MVREKTARRLMFSVSLMHTLVPLVRSLMITLSLSALYSIHWVTLGHWLKLDGASVVVVGASVVDGA
jgi:hypothetical protein